MNDPIYRTIEAEQIEVTQAAEAARIRETQDFGRLSRLMANEDMQWFIAKYFAPVLAREDEAAHNLALGKDACWEHLQRREVAKQLAEVLSSEFSRMEKKLRLV